MDDFSKDTRQEILDCLQNFWWDTFVRYINVSWRQTRSRAVNDFPSYYKITTVARSSIKPRSVCFANTKGGPKAPTGARCKSFCIIYVKLTPSALLRPTRLTITLYSHSFVLRLIWRSSLRSPLSLPLFFPGFSSFHLYTVILPVIPTPRVTSQITLYEQFAALIQI